MSDALKVGHHFKVIDYKQNSDIQMKTKKSKTIENSTWQGSLHYSGMIG